MTGDEINPRMDLDTRCEACKKYRYHDVDKDGFYRDGKWWCSETCFTRMTHNPLPITE